MKARKPREYRVGGASAHLILIVLSLLWMINFMDRQVMSAVLEPMRIDLGLSDTQAGLLHTIFLLSISFFSLPIAFLIDRWSRRKAVAVMAVIWSVFTFVTGLGRSFAGVFTPRVMVGVGEAGFSAGGTAMITAAYPSASRGRAMGIFNIFVPLGAALGYILGGYLSTHYGGWRTPFYVFAVPGIILGIAAYFLKDYKTVTKTDARAAVRGFLASAVSLFKIPSLKWLYIGHAMHNIMAVSILVWLPTFLMRTHNITEAKAGMTVGIISLMAIIGSPLGGFLADFWQKTNPRGRMLVPVVGDLVAAALLVPALLMNASGPGLIMMFAFGIFLMLGLPSIHTITQDVVTPGMKGISWGMIILVIYLLGGGWAPWVIGLISDSLGGGAYGVKAALFIAPVAGFLAGILFLIGSRYYPADREKVKNEIIEEETA
jgi:MFS family permease